MSRCVRVIRGRTLGSLVFAKIHTHTHFLSKCNKEDRSPIGSETRWWSSVVLGAGGEVWWGWGRVQELEQMADRSHPSPLHSLTLSLTPSLTLPPPLRVAAQQVME